MNQPSITLKGITWNHTRGFTSMVATAQRFHELHPEVKIEWSKRSLQAFADEPIDQLAQRYDLLVIDHPWTGFAARTGVIQPLNDLMPEGLLENLAANSVGKSHESYSYNNQQWALAIDAATPVAASRLDLLRNYGYELPRIWDNLLALAESGIVAIPGIPQDTLMSFYMLCSTLGEDVCTTSDYVVSEKIGSQALGMLRELGKNINQECFNWNPIQVYEAMTSGDDYVYSPFAYGYANYAQEGYARKLLIFHDTVSIDGQNLITTLGGTGLAISTHCQHTEWAARYAAYVAHPNIQKTLYVNFGGQPGHREAWLDETNNARLSNYFRSTLPTLDRAFLRPRYAGHMYFQDRAGAPIREFMMRGGDSLLLLQELNQLYRESLE
ncbi:MAG: carbohydrate ABC transporter substrate-binding protein, partial [Bacteroidota bacterium]